MLVSSDISDFTGCWDFIHISKGPRQVPTKRNGKQSTSFLARANRNPCCIKSCRTFGVLSPLSQYCCSKVIFRARTIWAGPACLLGLMKRTPGKTTSEALIRKPASAELIPLSRVDFTILKQPLPSKRDLCAFYTIIASYATRAFW